MDNVNIEKVWPGWKIAGELGEGVFGRVYLIRSEFDGGYVYAAAKVIRMPADDRALADARANNVSEDALRMYFGKFKNDLSWELAMYKSLACPALADVDSFVVRENDENAGWTGYMRTALYTPLKNYYENEPSGAADAERLGKELCAALEKCESFGVRHGDIKPENVLVTDNGSFVLSDLGVKRCLEKAGSNIFDVPVTPYDAPELDENKKYTQQSDIYSLGMVMRYVANGGTLNANMPLPPELEKIIARATAANPEERFPSASAMKAALLSMGGEDKMPRRATAAALAMDTAKRNNTVVTETYVNPRSGEKDTGKTIITVGIIVAAVLILAIVVFGLGLFDNKAPEADTTQKTEQSEKTGKDDKQTDESKGGKTGTEQDEHTTVPDTTPDTVPETNSEPEPDDETKPETKPETEQKPEKEPEPETKPEQKEETKPEKTQNTYLRADSDSVLITDEDLVGVSRSDAAMMLNEIYARHGRRFKTASIQAYFDSQEWYTARDISDAQLESEMNSTELDNIRKLSAYKKSLS